MCLSNRFPHSHHIQKKKIQVLYEAGNLVKANAPWECSTVHFGDNYKQISTIHGIFSVAVLWLHGLTCTGISSIAVEKGVEPQLPKDTELRFEEGSEWHHIRLKWKVCCSVTDFFLSHEYPSSPRLGTAWMLVGKRDAPSQNGKIYTLKTT